MEKFWEWAVKKDYAREWSDKRSQTGAYGICDDYGEPYIHRPQALIGYMVEYILEHTDEDVERREPAKFSPGFSSVDDLFDNLVEIIKSM